MLFRSCLPKFVCKEVACSQLCLPPDFSKDQTARCSNDLHDRSGLVKELRVLWMQKFSTENKWQQSCSHKLLLYPSFMQQCVQIQHCLEN